MSFDEDSCWLRSGHAVANFSLLHKIALNLLKNEKSTKVGVKTKRIKAGWDENYMMKVLAVGLKERGSDIGYFSPVCPSIGKA